MPYRLDSSHRAVQFLGTLLSHVALIFVSFSLPRIYPTSPLRDIPIHSSIFFLLASALCIFAIEYLTGTFSRSIEYGQAPQFQLRSLLSITRPRNSVKIDLESFATFVQEFRPNPDSLIWSTAICVALRLCVFLQIKWHAQCTISGVGSWLPFLLLLQSLRPQPQPASESNSPTWPIFAKDKKRVLLFIFLAMSNVIVSSALATPRSTYICPLSSLNSITTPISQVLGLVLDCYILTSSVSIILDHKEDKVLDLGCSLLTVRDSFIMSSIILSPVAFVACIRHFNYWWHWILSISWSGVSLTAWHTILFTAVVVSTLYTLIDHGPFHVVMLIVFPSIYSTLLWPTSDLESLQSPRSVLPLAGILFLSISAIIFVRFEMGTKSASISYPESNATRSLRSKMYILVILFHTYLLRIHYPQVQVYGIHPIDTLLKEAQAQSEAWLIQATASQTLAESVEEYKRRYKRHPPPGFESWYQFAIERDSIVIDDFDSTMEDLEPFWGLEPAEIRLRSQQIANDTRNDIARLIIRNGTAYSGSDWLTTHAWMLDVTRSMVEAFARFLPDMEIALNLNDEPRILLPQQKMKDLLSQGAKALKHNLNNKDMVNKWSDNREDAWKRPENFHSTRPFKIYHEDNFAAASISCPHDSPAHTSYFWDASTFCTSCTAPHSRGLFLSDWSLSASPCHQPDLRNLHGFYSAPKVPKFSHDLLPVFSQSKPGGFADILYPSPWNYAEKTKYDPDMNTYPDPSFANKKNTLFWRGTATEGVSRYGEWRGMVRQRFVQLCHKLPLLIASYRRPALPFLLPASEVIGLGRNYVIKDPSLSTLAVLNMSLDAAILGPIADGGERRDQIAQSKELTLVTDPTDFQGHWRYRYLFDTDGAGFSGRFLPFLASKSLPFRTGIFRCWYDSRLVAWKHFVPIDVRLHGLLSTLLYFMGGGRQSDGNGQGNVAKAEEMAESGREWAGKVLRKEDMEVYMFRLLLEWGRLTDDCRDEIGFVS